MEDGAVAMDGSTIMKVGTTKEIKEAYPDAEYIDAKGGVIMPALSTRMSISTAHLQEA